MKINRLFDIVSILLSKGTVTAKELAERFGVSTRTIYRDIDVLSSSGIPIYTNIGYKGGISLMDDYTMHKTMLSKKNVESMMIALKTLQATKYPDIESTLDRFASIFQSQEADDWIEVDFTEWDATPDTDTRFETIKRAILERRTVQVDYINRYNTKSTRTLSPLKLHFKGRSWYLRAYCHDKEDIRLFKINRVKAIELLDPTFDREDYTSLRYEPHKAAPNHPREMVELVLRFHPDILYRLYDGYNEDQLILEDDGYYCVHEIFPLDEWVYSYILSFGHYVEVLQPKKVRKEIAKRLKETISIYENK